MASVADSTRSDLTGGMRLAALSDALVRLQKEICGRGPNNARCFASGNAVVCVMHDGFTLAEQTLLEHGRISDVAKHREALYRLMDAPARSAVEDQLGRRVTAMTLAVDPANGLETAVFLLDEPPDL
jgi:uncharacterized protein YbcI